MSARRMQLATLGLAAIAMTTVPLAASAQANPDSTRRTTPATKTVAPPPTKTVTPPPTQSKTPATQSKTPATQTKAPDTQTKAPVTQTKTPATQTKAPVTQTKAPVTQTKAPETQTKTPPQTKTPVMETKGTTPPAGQTKAANSPAGQTKAANPPAGQSKVANPPAGQSKAPAPQANANPPAGRGGATQAAATRRDSALLGAPVVLMREVYEYERDGRRDPFLSLLTTTDLRPTLSDLKLLMTVVDEPGRSVALVSDAYDRRQPQKTLRVGTKVGRMRVTSIRSDVVVFTIEEFGMNRRDSLLLAGRDTSKVR